MSKLDVSNKAAQVQQQKAAEAAPKAEPKTKFGDVLKQRNAQAQNQSQAANQAGAQAKASAQQGAQQANAQMAAHNAGKGEQQGPVSRRPMMPNPHMAKLEQAAKQFDQQLAKAGKASTQGAQNLGEARTEAKATDMLRSGDRAVDTTKSEARTDVERMTQTETEGANRAKRSAQQLNNQNANATIAAKDNVQLAAAPTEGAKSNAIGNVKGVRKPREIPKELLDKLVEEVRVGVNEVGQSEFQIDLKEGVLQGMTLKVTADNGKVSCNFMGGDSSAKNFIESSEGSLSRALESKGLMLDSLKVTTA